MRFDLDELAADELEEGAREVYESQSLRNQYPQGLSQEELRTLQNGDLPEEAEYRNVVGSIAEYTMIAPPDEEAIAGMNES